jgi:sodium-independent sulfate anion transporter 11
VPRLEADLVGVVLPQLPAIVIILIIEHIAIAKSFGRIFNYTVVTSQEMCAQGAANILSPFVGGYVCTGSFGASAVLSKAGVRTPLAGLFSAFILILALYALTSVFYYIPMSALAGLIIHAVSNLATPPRALYKYWQLSPFELLIWVVGVVLALFTSLETSIYATIGLSFALLLIRLARTKGKLLGRVHIYRASFSAPKQAKEDGMPGTDAEVDEQSRVAFLPLDRKDASNPDIQVESPYPGVFIYRLTEGFNYINQAQHMRILLAHIMKHTRRTTANDGVDAKVSKSIDSALHSHAIVTNNLAFQDRLWNDPGPVPGRERDVETLPILRAVVLDFAAVNNVDITSVQGLIDVRNTLDRYAAPSTVEWHFASVLNSWTRRALAISGFGYPIANSPDEIGNWAPAFTVASSLAGATKDDERRAAALEAASDSSDEEKRSGSKTPNGKQMKITGVKQTGSEIREIPTDNKNGKGQASLAEQHLEPVFGVDRPFFHIDLTEAVYSAVRDAKEKDKGLVGSSI